VNTETIKETISNNAREASRLHAALHETARRRDESSEARDAWLRAVREFQERYNDLAFPEGYDGALDRLLAGDALAMEAAICFLELRPFFFHSGFMFKDLLRKSRKAPLSTEQRLRLDAIEDAVVQWRKDKHSVDTVSSQTHSLRTDTHG
jgi:hypothetical protein